MFYSHTFLARKGPLGTVWCAAHLQHSLKKFKFDLWCLKTEFRFQEDKMCNIMIVSNQFSTFILLLKAKSFLAVILQIATYVDSQLPRRFLKYYYLFLLIICSNYYCVSKNLVCFINFVRHCSISISFSILFL